MTHGSEIFTEPALGSQEERVFGEIHELWTALHLHLRSAPNRWSGMLARNLRARAIQGSNSIEGYVVSQEDALAAVLGDAEAMEADDTSWTAVRNYRDAMDYVLRLWNVTDFQYSKDLIRGLHYTMMRHDPKANPGTWRLRPVYVTAAGGGVAYEGPEAERLPKLMDALVAYLTSEDDQAATRMVRAGMAHLNLAMIHPFSDGNGRMSRCLQTLVLARGGVLDPTFCSIEEHLGRNTLEYYDVLARVGRGSWNPSGNALPWIRFCLKAHYQQARSAQRRLQTTAAVGEEIELLLSQRGLPDRAATSLVNAAMRQRLRNSTYRHEADVNPTLASRDLKALVEAGLLIPEGANRGRQYLASDELKELAARHRAKGTIEDPFHPKRRGS